MAVALRCGRDTKMSPVEHPPYTNRVASPRDDGLRLAKEED